MPIPTRLHSLDALRGVAALCVVLFHYRHFFYVGTELGPIDVGRLPFIETAYMLYARGGLAVDLFFSISGFVFTWLYAQSIAEGRLAAGKFAAMRFSRLYPLHLLTLLIVALGQGWMHRTTGDYFVYPVNDASHYVQNLLLVSSWGFSPDYSFNAPIWSVSIEMLLYLLFFLACRSLPRHWTSTALLMVLGYAFVTDWDMHVGRGVGSFFLGGLLFEAYRRLIRSPQLPSITRSITAVTLFLWFVSYQLFPADECAILNGIQARLQRPDLSPWLFDGIERGLAYWPILVLFPLTILSLALLEMTYGDIFHRLAWLGHVSYSSYLIHFPLQLMIVMLMIHYGLERRVCYSLGFLTGYFALLIALSLASYHAFEMPVQRYLRKRC